MTTMTRDYIRVLLCSYYTTMTGWGVLLTYVYDRILIPAVFVVNQSRSTA